MSEFRLPRWQRHVPIVDPKTGVPSLEGQRWQQSTVEKIETQEATQDQILADLAQAQADIITALEQAGIALDLAGAIMPDIPPVSIMADYTGVVLDGQLPRNISAQRFDGDTDVTTSATWSATTISGGATYTIGAATGVLNVTAIASTAVVEITSVYDDISRSRKVTINKVLQDPPPSSSGSTEYDSSITETTTDSYGAANAGPLTLTCGASGEVELAAPLETTTTAPTAQGCAGKWQVSPVGAGTWSDVDTEIASTIDAEQDISGYISVNQIATGLTAGNDYDFQLLLRNASGSATIYYVGTASATTS